MGWYGPGDPNRSTCYCCGNPPDTVDPGPCFCDPIQANMLIDFLGGVVPAPSCVTPGDSWVAPYVGDIQLDLENNGGTAECCYVLDYAIAPCSVTQSPEGPAFQFDATRQRIALYRHYRPTDSGVWPADENMLIVYSYETDFNQKRAEFFAGGSLTIEAFQCDGSANNYPRNVLNAFTVRVP